jgi:ABC-type oligopeptide transport system substrate-binding subunit
VVLETQINARIKQGQADPQITFPTMVLAHARDEISQLACAGIQQMWNSIGLNVVLRPLDDGIVVPPDDDWDFLYYQMMIQEPLTDAERLFGRGGVVQQISAPAQQKMDQLGYADSWQRVGKILRSIHRQVVNDVAIIPLWQIKEHYAFREDLKGLTRNPVHLYENVAYWRIVSTANGE